MYVQNVLYIPPATFNTTELVKLSGASSAVQVYTVPLSFSVVLVTIRPVIIDLCPMDNRVWWGVLVLMRTPFLLHIALLDTKPNPLTKTLIVQLKVVLLPTHTVDGPTVVAGWINVPKNKL